MTSEATVTITEMLETLPEQLKGRVVEHLREYIQDLRDEAQWNDSFSRTQGKLIETAKQVRKEIAEGKAAPLDIGTL
ncbi:MAG: hypothetical protein LGR52_02845 [Candidatus Thiosymbion ectosymbiont of Robbea hypermnestra]|nr:hypothetical protein [Candidatus Thiosymbion ectosymbiont of Robbea hypermnestra]